MGTSEAPWIGSTIAWVDRWWLRTQLGWGYQEHLMLQAAYVLDGERRAIVLHAIVEICEQRQWWRGAVHVRENHVHIVVDGECSARRMALDFKRYTSRALNAAGLDEIGRKRWVRGFSARYLPDRRAIDTAVRYVAEKQGVPMALFVAAR